VVIGTLFILSILISSHVSAKQANAGGVIKIGILSTTAGGPFVVPGEDGVLG
jgi:hypothetical protein